MTKPPALIVFFAATANQVRIFDQIAQALPKTGYEIYFLTCDRYYEQSAGEALAKLSYRYSAVPSKAPISDWCSMEETERIPDLEFATVALWKFFSSHKPHLLVVGNDTGSLEQLAIRTAERYGARTVRIQDGIQAFDRNHWDTEKENSGSQVMMYPPFPFEGGCDLLLCWSETAVTELRKLGFRNEIEDTGSVLHDELSDWEGYTPPQTKPFQVLVAGQSFAKFGGMWHAQEVSLYEHIIQMLLQRDDIEVVFRPHPESDLQSSYDRFPTLFQNRVRIDRDSSAVDLLRSTAALFTVSSTLSLEAAVMGIPTARLLYLRSNTEREFFLKIDAWLQKKIRKPDFPQSLCYGVPKGSLEAFARWGMRPVDGKATERVATALTQLLRNSQTKGDNVPEVTVIVDSAGDDPLPAVRTALRSDAPLEIIVTDRTSDGKISASLPKLLNSEKISVLRLPNARMEDALNDALGKAQGKVILRLHPETVVYPGLVEAYAETVTNQPRYPITSSWFLGRNELETFEGVVPVPETVSSADFRDTPSYLLLGYCYAFPKSLLGVVGGFRGSDNPDIDFIDRALSGTGSQVQVIQSGLYLNPPTFANPEHHQFAHHLREYYLRAKAPELPTEGGTPTEIVLTKESAELLLDQALKLMQRKQDRPAVNLLNRIVQHREDLPEAYYVKALAEARLDLVPLAKRTLSDLLEKYPEHEKGRALFEKVGG